MPDLTRRQMISLTAAAAACACAGCPLLAEAAAAKPVGKVDVGSLEDFAADGVTDRWAGAGFFVVRRGGRLYAVSSRCTHRNVGLVSAGGNGGFKCPRHGSTFDAAGRVTKSPARKPLPRLGIRLTDAGRVIVDPGVRFGEAQWDDAASYVPLKRPAQNDAPAQKRSD